MKKEIIKLRNDGLTYNEISEKLNCTKYEVRKFCIEEGLGLNPIIRRERLYEWGINETLEKKIINIRKKNKTYDEIYDELNNEATKQQIILTCKLNYLSKFGKYSKPSNDEIEKMQLDYDNGLTFYEISKKYFTAKETLNKYIKQRSVKNIDEVKKDKSKSVIEWRRRTKIKLVEYKGGECKCCGYNKSIKALEFHHLDPMNKDFTISGKSWSFERLKNEVDKCILVCNRCHVEIHEDLIKI